LTMRGKRARCGVGRWSLAVAMALSMGGAALAGPAAPLPSAPGSAPASIGIEPWLQRIQQAAASISYQGTLASNAGGTYSSSRVLHYCDGRHTYERLELLDGENRLQYRHNDQVVTVWPVARRAVVEHRDPVAQFPALPAATAARVLENYELQKLGQERVAGLEADVLLLSVAAASPLHPLVASATVKAPRLVRKRTRGERPRSGDGLDDFMAP